MKKTMIKVFCAMVVLASVTTATFATTDEEASLNPETASCKWSSAISSGTNYRYDCIATGTGSSCTCGSVLTEPKP